MRSDITSAVADLKLEVQRMRERVADVDRALDRVVAAIDDPGIGTVAYSDSADDGQRGDGFGDSRDDAVGGAQ